MDDKNDKSGYGGTVTVDPEPEPKPQAIEKVAGLSPIADVEALVKRAEYLGQKLDQLRKIAVARTYPGDWVQMGKTVYLEGDGGLRMAPVIGLRVLNKRVKEEVLEDGVVRVTYSCDAESALFGTRFDGIERTRRTDDGFLKGQSDRADIEDVRSACHKGMVAKAGQYCAGLTGLTPEELKERYGMDISGKVAYKTAASDVKREDQKQVASTDSLTEIHRILRKISLGDAEIAKTIMIEITKDPKRTPPWPGKARPEDLSAAGVAMVLRILKEKEAKWDHEMVDKEGGRE